MNDIEQLKQLLDKAVSILDECRGLLEPPKPYVVRWCDDEGNLQELYYETLDDSECEAADLKHFYDYVKIKEVKPNA